MINGFYTSSSSFGDCLTVSLSFDTVLKFGAKFIIDLIVLNSVGSESSLFPFASILFQSNYGFLSNPCFRY
jgi:hypothetical protein